MQRARLLHAHLIGSLHDQLTKSPFSLYFLGGVPHPVFHASEFSERHQQTTEVAAVGQPTPHNRDRVGEEGPGLGSRRKGSEQAEHIKQQRRMESLRRLIHHHGRGPAVGHYVGWHVRRRRPLHPEDAELRYLPGFPDHLVI